MTRLGNLSNLCQELGIRTQQVRNLFEEDPFVPRTGDNFERGIGNYDSKFGGGIGRFVYLGVAMRFND